MSIYGRYSTVYALFKFFTIYASLSLDTSRQKKLSFTANALSGDYLNDDIKNDLLVTRSCNSNYANSLTLVSTLDGGFAALDSDSGQLIWKLETSTEPLLSSSLSSFKVNDDIAKLKLVPSLEGGIYQLKQDKIEEIPLSAELLLGQFQKLPDGTHIVGGKEIKSYGIDAETGKLIYECNINGCKSVSKRWNLSERDVFVVRRTQQIIRAVSQTSGEERWNFSVGVYDVSFLEHPDHVVSCSKEMNHQNVKMRFNLAFGILEAVRTDAEEQVEWSVKFDSPIANVWRFQDRKIKPVDIFRHGLLQDLKEAELPNDPLLYLGVHNGQMYAQSSAFSKANSLPDHVSPSAQPLHGNEIMVVDQPYIGTWRPYIGTSPSRTPSLMTRNGLTVWNQLDYPYDNGFCMIALKRITTLKELNKSKDTRVGNKSFSSSQSDYETVPVSLYERWREILFFSIFISLFLQYTIFKLIRRKWKGTEQLKTEGNSEESIKRVKSVTASVSTSTDPTTMQTFGNDAKGLSSLDAYLSRYLNDFHHVECIGKGGFGVVFKARNKIDGCDYAVKRIYLPNCDEAREKVTREVKAMAKLDYPGIVRFYHSWWESPPEGWQETRDRSQLMSNLPGEPNIGFPKEWYIHIQSDEEDGTTEDTSSDESVITIRRKRNRSSMSVSSKKSSKSIGDDPFGRKVNDFLGIDDDLTDVDLAKNNDVFYEENSGDSFNIEFKNDSCTDKEMEESEIEESDDFHDCSSKDDRISHKNGNAIQAVSQKQMTENARKDANSKKLFKSRMSTKLVGRCCCKSEECIRAPPLYLYIQMQLCMRNTLKDWLNENVIERSRTYIMSIFQQILNAVEYCHNQGMMHRDLKPSNIFFAMDGSIKIGDFGLVTAITRPAEGTGAAQSAVDENHTGNVGTQLYMSPEQVNGDCYNHKVDMYALGLILFELLVPFTTQMERIKNLICIKQNMLPSGFEEKYPVEAKLLCWLLSADPDERPEAINFKNSDLFRKIL